MRTGVDDARGRPDVVTELPRLRDHGFAAHLGAESVDGGAPGTTALSALFKTTDVVGFDTRETIAARVCALQQTALLCPYPLVIARARGVFT